MLSAVRIGLLFVTVLFLQTGLGANAAMADEVVRMSAPVYDDPVDRSADFSKWLATFRVEALAQGISAETFDRCFAHVKLNPRVVELNENQPEFSRAVWDYMDGAVSSDRVAMGRERLKRHRKTFGKAEKRHGVPPSIITAIWGLESNFGANLGGFNVVEALATLAFEGRRAAFGREQLIAALKIIQSGDIQPGRMIGSWAGAMGQTQFIPTVFLQYAEDGNKDGKRDLWDTKADVFNSTANYLESKGWQRGEPCFDEVRLPEGFDFGVADISTEKSIGDWEGMSVTLVNGRKISSQKGVRRDAPSAILLPGGYKGPAFIAYPNFKAVLAYNNAISYALAICQLSNRFQGGPSFAKEWPREEMPILSRTYRTELQTLLNKLGFDVGEPDGVIGKKSREAIRAYQKKSGLPADGFATMSLLERLRKAP